ncbi:MAG: AbrB/MazE/SpoVT family DNA-binding domain-containing protein [Dongiaceae bacterium]
MTHAVLSCGKASRGKEYCRVTSKLSVKSQSTIPGEVRKILGLKAGDTIG